MDLTQAPLDTPLVITKLADFNSPVNIRLMTLGFVEGAIVSVIHRGFNYIVRLQGNLIAIPRTSASHIITEPYK